MHCDTAPYFSSFFLRKDLLHYIFLFSPPILALFNSPPPPEGETTLVSSRTLVTNHLVCHQILTFSGMSASSSESIKQHCLRDEEFHLRVRQINSQEKSFHYWHQKRHRCLVWRQCRSCLGVFRFLIFLTKKKNKVSGDMKEERIVSRAPVWSL